MNPMPRESGKRFPIVAATAIACAAWFIFVSNAAAAPQFPLPQRVAAPSNTSTYHATSGPDLVSLSRCAELAPLMGPSGKPRSVTEFGAVPDDGRDATAAIQRALDAMKPGEWLVFPPGRYVHSTRLRVQVPGVKLWGRGAHLHATNPADMAVMLMADGASIYGFTLTAITDKRGNKPHEARIAIHPRTSDAPMLRGNEVRGNRIVADAANDPRAANSATTTGVFVYRAREFLVAENYVERSLADGIHITAGSAFGRVVRNTVRETGDDMIAMVSYLGRREESAAQIAADLAARADRVVHDIVVEGNDLAGQYWGRGISLVGARGITVRGNRISDTTTAAAIYVAREASYRTAGVRDAVIEDNEIRRVQTTAPHYVAAGVSHGLRKTGHAAILVYAQIGDDEAREPALFEQLRIRDVRIANNRIEEAASDGIRISARGGSRGASRGAKGERGADEPINGIAIVGNRIERARGKPLDIEGVADAADLVCRGNTAAGGNADAKGCGQVRTQSSESGIKGADLACARDRRAAPAR